MKLILTSLLLGFLASNVAISQLNELRKAQDKGRQKLNHNSKSNYFSKSLYVNPFIGTGGHGHTYPGASAPFGMIQLSPDTRHDGWDGCSGYHYSDSIIYGFSHTHLSGTGVSDYGDLLIVPQNGKPRIEPGYESKNGYKSYFSHDDEKASPGYYSVHLKDSDIDVELSVTERAGMHKYVFNNSKGKKIILLDLNHRDKLLSSSINVVDKQAISGSRVSSAWAEEQHFYFFLELDTPFQKARVFDKKGKQKLLLIFPKTTKEVKIRVGISGTDIAGAKKNLKAEINHWNFLDVRAQTNKLWNTELDKITFVSQDKAVMTNFYTAVYHSYLAPNVYSDIDGRYRGRDNQLHNLDETHDKQYTVFSLWDTYRATHPLYTLTQVERTNQFVRTFIRQFEQSGDLPVWELAANETECMIGYHSVSVIADAYIKGIKDYDVKKGLSAMITTSNLDEFGKRSMHQQGYINTSDEPESVSKTLEYAYDDFCINQMIEQAKTDSVLKSSDLPQFNNGMYNFINVYDPSSKFMRARRKGRWFSPFNPSEVNFNYTEANSWQYSLYAPHAVGILSNLIGGKDSLELWLDRLFTTESTLEGRHQVDITGLIGQYAHGNEPSHHMAYLYNYTNAPYKTQYYTDKIMRSMYTNTPDGLSGNEDCGQMSAWYVLSSMGLYQIAPGNPYYDLGRPLMNEALIHLESGKTLTIKAIDNTPSNKYIQRIVLNGKELKRTYVSHEEIIHGGELVFYMGPKVQSSYRFYEHAPTLSELPKDLVPVPFFLQENSVFEDSMLISLDAIENGKTKIYYTLDGTNPTNKSTLFVKPFQLNKSTIVSAIAINETGESAVITNTFTKKDANINLKLMTDYADQYAAGGDFTLIDGVVGGAAYRKGDWQGYYGENVIAEISFDDARLINEIGVGCLRDLRSWIFYPSQIEISISDDGVHYRKLETIEIDEAEPNQDVENKVFSITTNTIRPTKAIRIKVINPGVCPEWHLGAGNKTWLFLDEIHYN